MKVCTVVIVYNISAELFCLQIEAIKKFCKDDVEIMVIDNSTVMDKSIPIQYHSKLLGAAYIKTMASSADGSDSHSFAANISYQKLKNNYSYFHYLDHDCVPVRPYSVVDILGEEKVIAGIGQHETNTFMWPGCVMWNNDKVDNSLIDFSPSHSLRLDTGAGLRHVIEKYGKDACVFFNEVYEQNPNFVDNKYGYFSSINDGMFFHVVNSSNWSKEARHEERINSMINLIKAKIDSYVD